MQAINCGEKKPSINKCYIALKKPQQSTNNQAPG